MAKGRKKGSKNKTTIAREEKQEKELEDMLKSSGVKVMKTKEESEKIIHIIKHDLIRCFKCGSSNNHMMSSKSFPRRTMMLAGEMIVGIRIQRRKCKDCSQNFITKVPIE